MLKCVFSKSHAFLVSWQQALDASLTNGAFRRINLLLKAKPNRIYSIRIHPTRHSKIPHPMNRILKTLQMNVAHDSIPGFVDGSNPQEATIELALLNAT